MCESARAHVVGVGVYVGMYMSVCCVQIYLCIFKF